MSDDDATTALQKAIGEVVVAILLNKQFRDLLQQAQSDEVLFTPTDEKGYKAWMKIRSEDEPLARKLQLMATKAENWKLKDIDDKLHEIIPEHVGFFWDIIRWGIISGIHHQD